MTAKKENDPMVEAVERVAEGLFAIAKALDRLGTADAATPMGAIEMLASEVKGLPERLASEFEDVVRKLHDDCILDPGQKVSEQLQNVAEAVRGNPDPHT